MSFNRTMDAYKWAESFMSMVMEKNIEIDKDLMVGWFANAIMKGWDEGYKKGEFNERSKYLLR